MAAFSQLGPPAIMAACTHSSQTVRRGGTILAVVSRAYGIVVSRAYGIVLAVVSRAYGTVL